MRDRGAVEALLADRAAAQTREAVARAIVDQWRAHPAMAALDRRLAAVPPGDGPATLDAAASLLEDVSWLEALVAQLAAAARADPLFEPPLRPRMDGGSAGLVLIDHPRLQVVLVRLQAEAIGARKVAALGPRAILFSGHHSLTRFVRARGAAIDLWEAEPAGPGFRAAAAPPARTAGRIELEDGAMLRTDGARRSWTWARAPEDIVLLKASTPDGAAPLAVEYRGDDGGYLAAHAGDGADSRVRLIARMLVRMGRGDAAPLLATLAREGSFDRRWAMARETLALDHPLGRTLLAALAADDPHDEVRAAAGAALERLPA